MLNKKTFKVTNDTKVNDVENFCLYRLRDLLNNYYVSFGYGTDEETFNYILKINEYLCILNFVIDYKLTFNIFGFDDVLKLEEELKQYERIKGIDEDEQE